MYTKPTPSPPIVHEYAFVYSNSVGVLERSEDQTVRVWRWMRGNEFVKGLHETATRVASVIKTLALGSSLITL